MTRTWLASTLIAASLGVAPMAADAADTVPYVGVNQPAPRDTAYPGTLDIHVDATDIAHRVFDVHETIPVEPGQSIYLLYPKWIPGHHRPSGPIKQMAGLVIHGDNGRRLTWTRDPYNVYAFKVDVPEGVKQLDVRFQFLAAQNHAQGPIRMTPEMLDLSWEKVSLYPAGYYVSRIKTRPSVTLPEGWKLGSALEVAGREGDTVTFKPIDYLNLIDSPIYAGKHFKRLDITSENSPPVHVDMVADAPKYLEVKPEQIDILKNIVVQMGRLYGAFHFDHYDFLLSLSNKLSHKGLEHSRSSEDSTGADFFTDWKLTRRNDLLTHEFNHSWNGKYRRGKLHATPDFNVPMNDQLMWVYEGQTQFYGNVVAVRAGLEDKATGFAKLANVAAAYDMNRPGLQSWRTVQDTTNDPTIAQRAPRPYRNYQGSEDYYSGGQLIWLAVDGKMRALSDNRHNLDDFARAFFGMHPGAWDINPYTAEDVYATLDKIVPFDWKTFLRERLDGHGNLAEGLELEGWKLVYTREPSAGLKAMMDGPETDFTWSIGFSGNKKGELRDVRWNGPAYKAGLAPGMTIISVNGTEYSPEAMQQAIKDAVDSDQPIDLMVKNFDAYQTLHIDYHDGLKYPSLERIEGTPDYLSELYTPLK